VRTAVNCCWSLLAGCASGETLLACILTRPQAAFPWRSRNSAGVLTVGASLLQAPRDAARGWMSLVAQCARPQKRLARTPGKPGERARAPTAGRGAAGVWPLGRGQPAGGAEGRRPGHHSGRRAAQAGHDARRPVQHQRQHRAVAGRGHRQALPQGAHARARRPAPVRSRPAGPAAARQVCRRASGPRHQARKARTREGACVSACTPPAESARATRAPAPCGALPRSSC